MKKIIALLLAMVAVVGLFAGCGGGGLRQLQLSDEVPYQMDESGRVLDGYFNGVEVEWWFSSHYDLNSDMYLFKKLEEVIGCKINVVCYDGETYQTKVNTALQTSSLPDMCAMVVSYPVFNVYGDQGAFVNLLDPTILSRMPNMKKAILDNPEAAELLSFYKSENGGLYSMPRYDTERAVNFGWMYREDIFEKHGIKMWTDSESFLDVLRQLKQLYPNSYPLTGASMESVFNRVCNNYGFNSTTLAYNWSNNQWYLGATDEGFYEMMLVFQTAWNEGLVDPDIFTNKVNHIDEAILNGTSFVYNSWIGRMATENPAGKEMDPNFQVSYAPHIGDGKADELPKLGLSGTVINAQSDPKVVEACLAIYNYLYSEEGIKVMTMGEEGVTYTVDANGNKVYKNKDGSVMNNPTIQTLEEQHGLWNGSSYVLASKDSVYFTYSAEEAEAQKIGVQKGTFKKAPAVTVPQDYADEYSDLLTELENDVKQYCQKFVKDGYSKADWQAQCATWNSKYARLFDILNGKA